MPTPTQPFMPPIPMPAWSHPASAVASSSALEDSPTCVACMESLTSASMLTRPLCVGCTTSWTVDSAAWAASDGDIISYMRRRAQYSDTARTLGFPPMINRSHLGASFGPCSYDSTSSVAFSSSVASDLSSLSDESGYGSSPRLRRLSLVQRRQEQLEAREKESLMPSSSRLPDGLSNTALPPDRTQPYIHCLQPGSVFQGSQTASHSLNNTEYMVEIKIISSDLANAQVSGELRIKGLIKAHANLTTFFTVSVDHRRSPLTLISHQAEIISPNVPWHTSQWLATPEVDDLVCRHGIPSRANTDALQHWKRFPQYQQLPERIRTQPAGPEDWHQRSTLFLRLKEHTLMSDDGQRRTKDSVEGASFAGLFLQA